MGKTPSYAPQSAGGMPGSAPQPQQQVHPYQGQQVQSRHPSAAPSPAPQPPQSQPQYYRQSQAQQRQMQNSMNPQAAGRPGGLNHVNLGMMQASGSSPTQQGYYQHQQTVFLSTAHPASQAVMQAANPAQILYSAGHQLPPGPGYRYSASPYQNQNAVIYVSQQNPPAPYHPLFTYLVPPTGRSSAGVSVMNAGMAPAQSAPPKRERKLLSIVDPNTNRDVFQEIIESNKHSNSQTPPVSGASSARDTPPMNQTPPPSEQSDVAAQFARQVAAVASAPMNSTPPTVAKEQPRPQQQQPPQQQPPPPSMRSTTTVAHPSEVADRSVETESPPAVEAVHPLPKMATTEELDSVPPEAVPAIPATNKALPPQEATVAAPVIAGHADGVWTSAAVGASADEETVVAAAIPEKVTKKTPTAAARSSDIQPLVVTQNIRGYKGGGSSVPVSEIAAAADVGVEHQRGPPLAPPTPPSVPVPPPLHSHATSSPMGAMMSANPPRFGAAAAIASGDGIHGSASMKGPPMGPMSSELSFPPPPFPQRTEAAHPSAVSSNESAMHSAPAVVPVAAPAGKGTAAGGVTTTAAAPAAPPLSSGGQRPPPTSKAVQQPHHHHHQQHSSAKAPLASTAAVPAAPASTVAGHQQQQAKQNGEMGTDGVAERDEAEAKDNKKSLKTSRKKASRELNRKGEMKEGSDMDSLVDKEPPLKPASKTAQPAASVAATVSAPPPKEIVDGKAAVEQQEANEESGKENKSKGEQLSKKEEQQRKVVEKNEENARVSLVEECQLVEPVIEDEDQVTKPSSLALKYEYKEDQWSPLNPEGKKQYDRSFLLQLQSEPMSQKKPEGLPDLEVIKDSSAKPRAAGGERVPVPVSSLHAPKNRSIGGGFIDFTPNFLTLNSGRLPMRGRSSQQGRKEIAPKKINITLSLNQDVKLHEADDAWKPSHKVEKELDPEMEKSEKLYKIVRGILNKLTPQNFRTLLGHVNSLEIDTEQRLTSVIDLVFEKAIDEPNFSVPYANMCYNLAMKKVPHSSNVGDVNFRKLILTKCQKEFEKDVNDEVMRDKRLKLIKATQEGERKKELQMELKEDERKSKRRSLGNIRFIGELFKLSMLTPNIMHDCLQKLITAGDEDSLECLCKLMTTIGKDLASVPIKQSQDSSAQRSKHSTADNPMNPYFMKMQEIVNKRHTSSRVRFMLQDVIDLRKCNWVPRRDENNPKTLEQIHREAQEEEKQQLLQQQSMMAMRRYDDRGFDRRGGSGRRNDENWNIANKPRVMPNIELNKRISAVQVENTILAPKMAMWNQGSLGGMKPATPPSQTDNDKTPAQNKFSALLDSQGSNDSRTLRFPLTQDGGRGSKVLSQMPPLGQRRGGGGGFGGSRNRDVEKGAVAAAAAKSSAAMSAKSQATSRDNSKTRENEKVNVEDAGRSTVEISEAFLEPKVTEIVDEFLWNKDFQEAILCIKECFGKNLMPEFVTAAINQLLERASTARKSFGSLFTELVKHDVMSVDHFRKGLNEILVVAEDMALDIPKFFEYMAELLTPLLQDTMLPLAALGDAANLPKDLPTKFLGEVLKLMSETMEKSRVRELWRSSGLNLKTFLKSSSSEKFLSTYNLEFLVQEDLNGKSSNPRSLSEEELRRELEIQLTNLKSENEKIFDWVKTRVPDSQKSQPSFIRALVTAVAESAIQSNNSLDEELFHNRCIIIKRYVDHSPQLELESLYACQILMHKLQHPSKLLNHIFNKLYDQEVISEDAFIQWKVSTDPNKIEGHGVAVNSVNPFLSFLSTHDQEDEDDEVAGV